VGEFKKMSSDPFFVTPKIKKRKSMTSGDVSSNGKKVKTRNGEDISQINDKVTLTSSSKSGKNQSKKKLADEKIDQEEKNLNSDDDIGPGGIDDMDFDNDNNEEEKSDEDENNMETPTEKRRRLAKQYIESVKKELGSIRNS
jgi:ribosomal RNA-processing protein 9